MENNTGKVPDQQPEGEYFISIETKSNGISDNFKFVGVDGNGRYLFENNSGTKVRLPFSPPQAQEEQESLLRRIKLKKVPGVSAWGAGFNEAIDQVIQLLTRNK